MTCPICDQKPLNCDCTDEEKRLWRAADELSDEVERLRLTDEERKAIEVCIQDIRFEDVQATLRGLLERTKCAAEGE
jgi:hypothetical protein